MIKTWPDNGSHVESKSLAIERDEPIHGST